MKVVINGCYGGFSLSDKAEDLYAKKSGFELFRYSQTKYKHNGDCELYERVKPEDGDSLFNYTFKKDLGDSFSDFTCDDESGYWYSTDIDRTDPLLIEVVEELGKDSSGSCASLEIVEIPDGISWEISEYDGNETVEESHRSWS